MGRVHTFVVNLQRKSKDTNWGLRLVGGSDLATPLIVTRVTPGSPAGRELIRGDIIAKIDDYDARDLRHEDAQNLFRNASNQIRIVVQRGGSSSHIYTKPLSSSSFVGRVPTPTFYHELSEDVDRDVSREMPITPRSPIPSIASSSFRTPSPMTGPSSGWRGPESLPRSTPIVYTPLSVHNDSPDYRSYMTSPCSTAHTDEFGDESIHNQPYRTTPLVLPGAKVRREPGPTESYLRHHPNPAMRAPPSHDYRDTLMKQKMAHKQYNSPINLYSEQNIANSVRQQSSPLPSNGHYARPQVMKSHKPTMLYDPAKSETFRMLQEEGLGDIVQEVPIPVETKVFTAPPPKKSPPTPKPTMPSNEVEVTKTKQTTFVNAVHEEHIQQSNSFKRLMFHVLGDTDF